MDQIGTILGKNRKDLIRDEVINCIFCLHVKALYS